MVSAVIEQVYSSTFKFCMLKMQEICSLKHFIFTSKCTKMRLVAGQRTRWGSLQRSPRSPSWDKGKRKGRGVGKGRGVQRHPRRRKMRHRNHQRDNKKEIGGTTFKFGKLIFRKIIKIVATRCHILRLKCTKFDIGWGSAPDPAGGAQQRSPKPPSWI